MSVDLAARDHDRGDRRVGRGQEHARELCPLSRPCGAAPVRRATTTPGAHRRITGDRAHRQGDRRQPGGPLGRTPRSNPATYTKVFDEIRKVFSQVPEARTYGYTARPLLLQREGRALRGLRGRRRAPHRDALPSRSSSSPAKCVARDGATTGRHSRSATRGRTIADVLDMTVSEALVFMENVGSVRASSGSSTLHDVGLDYLHLGQSCHDAVRAARPNASSSRRSSRKQGHGADPLPSRRADHRPPFRRSCIGCSTCWASSSSGATPSW